LTRRDYGFLECRQPLDAVEQGLIHGLWNN
jgi:hypothetical protein